MARLDPISSPTGQGWLIAALCAGNFLAYFDRSILSAVLPLIKADFGLSDGHLGLLQGSLFASAYIVGSLCCWWAPSRWANAFLFGGLALWTAGEAGAALSTGIDGLVIAQFLIGLGQAAFIPVALTVVASWRGRIGFAVSLFTIGSTLGRGLSVLCAGLALTWLAMLSPGASWRSLYGGVAGLGMLLLIAMAVALRQPRSTAPFEPAPIAEESLVAYLKPGLAIVVISLPVILVTQSLAAWMPALVARGYATDAARAAILVGATTLITLPLGQVGGGWLIDRFPAFAARPFRGIAGCMIVACAAIWAMVSGAGLTVTLIAFGAANMALGIASLTGLATLQRVIPPALRSRANALFLAVVTAVGFGIGPALVGRLSDLGGEGGSALGSALRLVAVGAMGASLLAGLLVSDPGDGGGVRPA